MVVYKEFLKHAHRRDRSETCQRTSRVRGRAALDPHVIRDVCGHTGLLPVRAQTARDVDCRRLIVQSLDGKRGALIAGLALFARSIPAR